MGNRTALGKLAKSYARGLIDRDKYLKSRTELITGIISGEVPLVDIDHEPIPSPENETITEITKPSARKARYSSGKIFRTMMQKPNLLFIAAITMVLLLLAIFLYPKFSEDPILSNNHVPSIEKLPDTGDNTQKTVTVLAGETLLTEFLTEKDWSYGSLNGFIETWLTLSEREREMTLKTKRMQSMNDAIYEQFLEEKALANIDREKAIEKQYKLIEFAQTIGINDDRLLME